MIIDTRPGNPGRRTGAHRRRGATTPGAGPGRFAGGHRALPVAALIVVAVIWGVTFTVVDHSVVDSTAGSAGSMPPADLVAWRFGVGSILLLLIGRSSPALPRALRRRGLILGVLLGTGFLLQAWALTYTDAVMSGFITGLLVVFAPVAGWLAFRDRPARSAWLGVAISMIGLTLLSLRGAGFGPGELLTLVAASMWSLHLVLLARWAVPGQAVRLARLQIATVAGMAVLTIAAGSVVTGRSPVPVLPADSATWLSVSFLAALATAGAMVLLTWAQSRMSATRAAVILTLEPAVAGVTAACLGDELGPRTMAGGALLLIAMIIVELRAAHGPGGRRV